MPPGEPTCTVSTVTPPGKRASSLAAATVIRNALGCQKEKRYFASTYRLIGWWTVGASSTSAARTRTAGAATVITTMEATMRPMTVMATVSPDSGFLETGLSLVQHLTPCADGRHRQSQILPQGDAGKILAEQPAALQLRHDEAHEVLIGTGHVGGGEDKTIAGRRCEP